MRGGRWALLVAFVLWCTGNGPARGQVAVPEPNGVADDYRAAFARGVAFQQTQQWGRAMAEFRAAARGAVGRNAAVIRFNIGICERALGHFALARRELRTVLEQADALDPERVVEARATVVELEALLARVDVQLDPPSAILSVDGGPLIADSGASDRFVAGLSHDSTRLASLHRRSFTLLLDPGAHIFRANRPGHGEGIVQKTYRPGEHAQLDLTLAELKAHVRVTSDPPGAVVRVDGREAGVTPLELERRAGRYRMQLELRAYNVIEHDLSLAAGQQLDLTPRLTRYVRPVTRTWWFWTSMGGAIAGAVVTALVIRARNETPPYDGGSEGWVARAP